MMFMTCERSFHIESNGYLTGLSGYIVRMANGDGALTTKTCHSKNKCFAFIFSEKEKKKETE